MQVKLVWSPRRQMWVGKSVARPAPSFNVVSGFFRWLRPTAVATNRRAQTSSVWQSVR